VTTGQAPKLREVPKQVLKPGTVGVVSGELSRYSIFSMALLNLLSYSGELVSHFDWMTGSNVTGNCNDLARRRQGDWLWLIGDDHVFHPSLLERLVMHDVDVVVPHCLQRAAPYPQVIYEGEDHDASEQGTHILHTALPEDELIEIYASGQAGMLIKSYVLEAIGEPYFETYGKQNEDLEFCRKIRKAGFKIHCDTGALLGHIAQVIVWPQWHEEHNWGIRMNVGAEQNIFLRRFGPSGSMTPA
jgi:hypothetical protein